MVDLVLLFKLSGPLEDDSLGEAITYERLCLIVYGETTNFLDRPLTEDYLCELLDKALTFKSSHLSCLVCRMSAHSKCVCKTRGIYSDVSGKSCDRNLRLDSGVEVEMDNAVCDTNHSKLFLHSCSTCHSTPVKISQCCCTEICGIEEEPSCLRHVILSPSSSGMSPPSSGRRLARTASSTTSGKENLAATGNCSCFKVPTRVSSNIDADYSVLGASGDRPPPLDHHDSGIGLESDPGFFDMESGSEEEDWNDEPSETVSVHDSSPHKLCQPHQDPHSHHITSPKHQILPGSSNNTGGDVLQQSSSHENTSEIHNIDLQNDSQGKPDSGTEDKLVSKGKKLLFLGSKILCIFFSFFLTHLVSCNPRYSCSRFQLEVYLHYYNYIHQHYEITCENMF